MGTLSKRLRELRTENGLTQKQCAEQLGVDSTNYNKWENGVNPSLETICQIADYFEVSTDFLLGRTAVKQYSPEQKCKMEIIEMQEQRMERQEQKIAKLKAAINRLLQDTKEL